MVLKSRFYIIVFISLIVLLNSCKTKNNKLITSDNSSYTEISKGSHSSFEVEKNLIIKDNATYQTMFAKIHEYRDPKPVITGIDFENEMLVALFMGMKNSGGHSISIDSIVSHEKELHVFVKRTRPKGMATMVMTQPYYLAKIKKTEKTIVFK